MPQAGRGGSEALLKAFASMDGPGCDVRCPLTLLATYWLPTDYSLTCQLTHAPARDVR